MAAELLLALARCNVAATAAIVAVLALRGPVRRWFGAQSAYAAWLAVPMAAAGSLMPAGLASGAAGPVETTNDRLLAWLSIGGHATALTMLWLGGALAGIAVAAWRHQRFIAAVKAGRAGPGVVGIIQPRLVTPADYAVRYTNEQRRLVRAHELAHIDRQDARYNAAAALATWVCWFNPLLHLAARAMREDQELACDATVMRRLPASRRLYAETLLRTRRDGATPVLGCAWRSGAHPLEARIRMLLLTPPTQGRRALGWAVLLASGAIIFSAAWAIQPPSRAALRPTVILFDLAPPDAAAASEGAEVYRIEARLTSRPPGLGPKA